MESSPKPTIPLTAPKTKLQISNSKRQPTICNLKSAISASHTDDHSASLHSHSQRTIVMFQN
jgi:hypothetical protein